ncbi:Low-density lipoprotein receptor-related protein 11 [Frankliniella fusca]|uniref:Low-density lipoprotein receptor-related protein 11 n=1 Tax=Frankliniella fusca TaxID=407009 RepID=A0AAE1LC65_9NEOP|nr:Low-density lipoprotein receptor-related protein 11 [Frankliniella fusca]
MFQRAGVAGPARGTGPGAGSQWDAGANPFRPGVEHNSHIFTHKGGVLDSDHYHHNHPHQMFGDDLQNTGAAGYGDALRGTSGAAGPYYGQGNANARPSDDYPPLRTGAGPLGGPGPQRGSPAYGGQYGAQPDYFYEDGGSESRLQIGNIGRLQGLPVSAADDSGRRIEADLTSVPYERQLSPQQPAQQQPAQQQLQPAQPQQPAQQQPAASAASPAAPTAAPAASPAQGAPSPTLRPRPQDKPNSVKKQLEHAKPADKSTVPPLTTVTVKPSGETPTRNQTEAVQQKPTSTQIGSKKASGGLAPSVSSGSDANLSLEQAALVDITDGPTVSPKGAVISLVLGMVLTSFMVVVIVCRVRMIKRKLLRRGGQSSYAHDADYLVNGMYL